MVDMRDFQKEFNKEYDFIYNANKKGKYVAGYDEAVDCFDNNMTKEETDVLKSFVEYRRDPVTSDREAAAFMFIVDKFI